MNRTKRISKYVRRYTIENLDVLYCMSSERVLVLTPELSTLFMSNKNDVDRLKDIHPQFYNRLVDGDFLIDCDKQELDCVLDKWKQEDINPDSIKLTINPTLQCNLSCWYCYENHGNKTFMDETVVKATMNYIHNLFEENPDTNLIVSFFGGEPLLYFNKVIEPIITFAQNEARKHSKNVGIAFTTNGTLLTDNICAFLKGTNAPVSFQITLDGSKVNHNKTRFFKNGVGSYDIVTANIRKAVSYGFSVNVRFNYTNKNYSDCLAIMDEFNAIDETDKKLIDFSFHKVWQEDSSPEMEESIRQAHKQYLNEGFEATVNDGISAGRCYADAANNVVINYDGLVYKCTARDFTPENAEGLLSENGTISWNEKGVLREQLKFGHQICHECPIFPICHNGCSQDKLEQPSDIDSCPRGFPDNQKETIAINHATSLLINHLTNGKHNNF